MKTEVLRSRMRALPPRQSGAGRWSDNALSLSALVSEFDPAMFLTWPVVIGTMFVGDGVQVSEELAYLRTLPAWPRYERALKEDLFGAPEISQLLPGSSGNLIHQAYHLSQWEWVTGQDVSELSSIVEIGGGYGAMCKLVRSLGFHGGYYLLDIPEFSLLQEYYLANTIGTQGSAFLSDPVYLPAQCDLLIGIYSISELPAEERAPIFERCQPRNTLIAYMAEYDGVNNEDYFVEYATARPGAWAWQKALWSPTCRYLIGCPAWKEVVI